LFFTRSVRGLDSIQGTTIIELFEHFWYLLARHGDHGETVITPVCGTGITGSIPVGRPSKKPSALAWGFLLDDECG
jgi:hypothetical protein